MIDYVNKFSLFLKFDLRLSDNTVKSYNKDLNKYIDLNWDGACYSPEESKNQLGKPQIKKLERNFTRKC